MGDQVAGQIDTQASKAQSKIGETQSIFNQKVQENSVGLNENLLNEAVSDSANFVKDAEKVNQFSRMRDAAYKGPSGIEDLEGYQVLQTDFNKAQELLSSAENESGRQTLLNETYKRADYTSGQNKLDQLLLQNDPNARSAFSNLQTKYSGLSGLLSGAQTSAAEQAKAQKAQTEATRNRILETLGREDDPSTEIDESKGEIGGLFKTLSNRSSNYASDQNTLLNKIDQERASAERAYSEDVLKALGLNEGDKLYDLNLASYGLDFTPANVSASSVQTADEMNRYQALYQLLGSTGTLNPDAVGKAGGVNFEIEKLKNDILAKEKQAGLYQQAQIDAQNAYDTYSANLGEGEIREINLMLPGRAATLANLQAQIEAAKNNFKSLRTNETVRRKVT